MIRRITLLILFLWLAPVAASAQTVSRQDSVRVMTELEMRDGSRFVGDVVEETADTIRLRSLSGTEVDVRKADIDKRRSVTGRVADGRFVAFDPNRTRLFFGPTARPLGKGQWYFADYWLFFGFVGGGVTEHLTLAGGGLLIPELANNFFYVAPKLTLLGGERRSLGVGVLAGFVGGDDLEYGNFGIVYGVYTHGWSDNALTLGAGFGFAEGEVASSPTLMVGYEKGLSRRTKFITENWIFPQAELVLYSGGIRFYGERLAADLAFIGFSDGSNSTPLLPWIGFAYNFGK